ncbi:MAG: hypothetical protein WAL80_10170 [Xanthobacteraceae bacterium]|jgi:hypothetical protein
MADNSIKQRAAHLKIRPAFAVGKAALPEYEAAADALEDKIARLKKLRLARDAAALAAPSTAVAAKKKPGRKKKPAPVSPAVLLSDWLKSRHAGGHNN